MHSLCRTPRTDAVEVKVGTGHADLPSPPLAASMSDPVHPTARLAPRATAAGASRPQQCRAPPVAAVVPPREPPKWAWRHGARCRPRKPPPPGVAGRQTPAAAAAGIRQPVRRAHVRPLPPDPLRRTHGGRWRGRRADGGVVGWKRTPPRAASASSAVGHPALPPCHAAASREPRGGEVERGRPRCRCCGHCCAVERLCPTSPARAGLLSIEFGGG